MLWIVTALAGVAFLALLDLILPKRPRPWRTRLRRRLSGLARRVRRRAAPPPDPFVALRVQERLGVISTQIRELIADRDAFAKKRRLEALRAAYDDLLDEGCRLAGVPTDATGLEAEERRWREEQELAARGWTW